MYHDAHGTQTVLEGPYRPGEWDTCPNVSDVCPGCLKPIHALTGGVHSCDCQDVLWRSHPLATGPDVPWQVIFLDDVAVC